MAAPSKAQLLNDVYTLLKRRYKLGPRDQRLSVLEAVIYGICHEGATRADADQAMNRFRDQFFDWNEVRVSSIEEIRDVLAGSPEAEERANRLRRFLRQLFEKTYGFALDGLTKKPLKDSVQALQDFEAMESDYVHATVVQQALGGHAMPVDAPIRRGLARLGVAEEAGDFHAIRSLLERAVPKNRGSEFVDLMEELTHDTCVEGPPDCPRCELRKICPTGQARLAADKAASRSAARAKPPAPAQEALPASRRGASAAAPAAAKSAAAKAIPERAAPGPAPGKKASAPKLQAGKTPAKPAPAAKKPAKGRDPRGK